MEVHTHTAPIAIGRKKWTHYLWEFLMLFLAVFCGFLAENQREHMVEHRREKQYIQNLLEDLKRDTGAITNQIIFRHRRSGWADSLIRELSSAENLAQTGNIYFHAYSLTTIRLFGYSNTTVSQLKNSGSMRLIRKRGVADSINAYDIAVDNYQIREGVEREITGDYRKAICYVLDANVMLSMEDSTKPGFGYKRPEITSPLLSKEANILNPVKGLAAQLHTRNAVNIYGLKELLKKAMGLIKLLKNEYHLE